MSGSSSLLSSVFLRRPSSAPCFLQVLPLAVSVSIVTYLPLPSIASCSAVSALLFVLCQDERVWRQLCRTRWSRLQHARSLLTALEWSTLYGEEERELNGQEEEHSTGGRKDRDSGTAEGCLSALSWKERYVAAEVDLCRSYITLPEVMKTRWAFRFLPNVFFDHSQTTYPVFTSGRLITGLDMTYEWRFVDSERLMPARCAERGELTAYERRRLLSGEQIAAIRTANRPYWLRSSGTDTPPAAPAPRLDAADTVASRAASSTSALHSPSLPHYRFPPGHSFFRLSQLQLADLSTSRQLQVSHFPPLSIERMPDGGWQMINQYVLFRSVSPQHSNTAADSTEDGDHKQDEQDEHDEREDEEEDGAAESADDESACVDDEDDRGVDSTNSDQGAQAATLRPSHAHLPSEDDERMH